MLVTDDAALAAELRYLRAAALADRRSVSVGARVPLQAGISELTAALGWRSWRASTRSWRAARPCRAPTSQQMLSFEGIKPPYVAPGVDEVHWMLYVVHLGKRFTASACAQIIDDLATEGIEAVPCTASRCTSSLPTRSRAGGAAACRSPNALPTARWRCRCTAHLTPDHVPSSSRR
jgi:dTDP-4-amino-4,6-dideoxygalactose transaminase